ncbi:hypothetical protein AABB24_023527 [Solanum stoloniferum]|uniref:Uncharacterized protein n=1 Tax=Solanum stoloniferum TaxID=62892 RepID=A0ABD2SJY8_9SOLN
MLLVSFSFSGIVLILKFIFARSLFTLLMLCIMLFQVFWAFSIYLEAVAILPQLVLLQRSGNVDNLTGQYVFFLGAYCAFYILNWIYRYLTEQCFTRWISGKIMPSFNCRREGKEDK